MLIYKWTNLVNGKIYIGQTSMTLEKRTRLHVNNARAGSQSALHNAIRKYNPASFKVEAIYSCFDENELNKAETMFINDYACLSPKGYNLKPGGYDQKWHPEMKQKASKSALKRIAADNGKQIKEFQKIGQQALKGKDPWNKGKKATDQAKANQSLSHMGQQAWNKGKETPEEIREKQRKAALKRSTGVVCIETKEQWPSAEAAAKVVGTSATHIRRLCKSGKPYVKTGHTFKFTKSA